MYLNKGPQTSTAEMKNERDTQCSIYLMPTNLRHKSDAEVQIRNQEAHLLSIRIDTSQSMFFF